MRMDTTVKDATVGNESANTACATEPGLVIHLRDINPQMVSAWKEEFKTDHFSKVFKISEGDIFDGGPPVDAIVSPANSFGFMDGGIDLVYSVHFGWQMMERLQQVIKSEHDGELLVGDAIIIPTYAPGTDYSTLGLTTNINGGKPIKYLISAPTMRVPMDVAKTVNAYLAFRACLRAVKLHNLKCQGSGQEPIRSFLCPGLGTCVGQMPFRRCAIQMKAAYETVIERSMKEFVDPQRLEYSTLKHEQLIKIGQDSEAAFEGRKTTEEND